MSTLLAFFLLGCSEEKSSSAQENVSQNSVKEKTQEVSQKLVQDAGKIIKESKASAVEVVKPVQKVIETKKVAVNGSLIYKTCATCHGAHAEKKALNKSQVIQGWDSAKIISALHGYKDGTYGSSMKGVMKPQVSKLSEAEIEAVAKYISNL